MSFLKDFIEDDEASFDQLAKIFAENFFDDIDDFVFCLRDNQKRIKKVKKYLDDNVVFNISV